MNAWPLLGDLKDLFFSWVGSVPPDPPFKSAAVAASAGQIGTPKPGRLLSQPPPATVGRQAAAIAAFEWHGGLGAEAPESQEVWGAQPTQEKIKNLLELNREYTHPDGSIRDPDEPRRDPIKRITPDP